ncbi:PREDICTED: protein wech-like [Branchiostoma belcheri]|uniref:Protein wech-like n=1 Tax=Branchiostoma belcheri TaxID=7741 RepID=A0A6P5ASR7_BRABE|nr:PREDICTED: protein wech-like [Branchiostoma belcheri]
MAEGPTSDVVRGDTTDGSSGAEGPTSGTEGPTSGTEGPTSDVVRGDTTDGSSGAEGPTSGAEGPTSGAEGPTSGTEGPTSDVPTEPVDTSHATGQPTLDTSHTTGQPSLDTPHTTGQPTMDTVAIYTTESYAELFKSEPVVFGEEGAAPGQIEDASGVAVSADNEIFIADVGNRRVQVFSMNGTFLRLFPTKLPGGDDQAMYPTDVDIDGEGRIWVVGKDNVESIGAVRVVQYGTDGLPLTTFDVKRRDWYPAIAVNARRNRIMVVARGKLFKFKPDGSLESFGKKEDTGLEKITSDGDGNILATDVNLPGVQMYDHTGRSLHSFRTASVDGGDPVGICVDPQGRIMVADSDNGRVDMFTSRGEFVRMVVNVTDPWAIALAPGGQLVVTAAYDFIVTIFPPWMVYPDEHFV